MSTGTVSYESSDAGADNLATAATLVDISRPMRGIDPHQSTLLHQATVRDWHAAGEPKRLAAAAALLAAASGPQSQGDLQDRAAALARCISETTRDMIMNNARVGDVAAACLQMLGH